MYIPIQKNIYCEQCKDCGTRPVVEQMPKGKFRLLCPNCKEKNAMKPGFVEIDKWNLLNAKPAVLRKVG
jgi:ribosomal protein L44E